MSSRFRTEVCITIDTEFSIGGALARPDQDQPVGEQAVHCVVENREEGLGFLLNNFAEAGIRATFFVEALQTCYFGNLPMANIVDRIASAGHDVELHFHPTWLHFLQPDWATRTSEASDACSGCSDARLDEVLAASLDAFSLWGIDRPVAARSGNLDIDSATHRAFKRFSIPISSSVGLALRQPREERLRQFGGRHWTEGVLEVPVLTFHEFEFGRYARQRLFTITACSWSEIKTVLWGARRAGISPVVLLTHPSEFVKHRDLQYRDVRRNRLNQERMIQLIRFLRHNSDDFEAVTFREREPIWLSSEAAVISPLCGTMPKTLSRMIQNFMNDHVWIY